MRCERIELSGIDLVVLVDSSIWIELFRKGSRYKMPEDRYHEVVLCGVILQEIFQGLKVSRDALIIRNHLLAFSRVADPCSLDLYLEGADIFANARRRGVTVRSSVDCLVAAIALRYGLQVWHRDRDFLHIARYTSLEQHTGPEMPL